MVKSAADTHEDFGEGDIRRFSDSSIRQSAAVDSVMHHDSNHFLVYRSDSPIRKVHDTQQLQPTSRRILPHALGGMSNVMCQSPSHSLSSSLAVLP